MDGVDWFRLAQNEGKWRAFVSTFMLLMLCVLVR